MIDNNSPQEYKVIICAGKLWVQLTNNYPTLLAGSDQWQGIKK